MAALEVDSSGVSITRRAFLGAGIVGGIGILFGNRIQSTVGSALGNGLAQYLPGGDQFRIYTVTSGYPSVSTASYRLKMTGLFENPMTFSYQDLVDRSTDGIIADFQCVTGWRVPSVHWKGILLSKLIEEAKPTAEVTGYEFYSYDGTYTESLTHVEGARRDIMIATSMFGAPITTEHGGPVRLYVAPMYGYKSIKWLSEIRAVKEPTPGYWEQLGYDVEAYIGASNGRSDKPVI